jgi:hypothetical protein
MFKRKKSSFVLSIEFLMDKQVITISEDVMNTVIKPMSMFLCDLKKGTVFTHKALNPKGESVYDTVETNGIIKMPVFLFTSSKGGTFKFTTYDLRNFTCNGIPFNTYFVQELGRPANMQSTFKLSGDSKPLLVNKEKVYAPFCYVNYTAYAAAKELQVKGTYPTAEMLANLKANGINKGDEDKYYRTVDTDTPLFYYAPEKAGKK